MLHSEYLLNMTLQDSKMQIDDPSEALEQMKHGEIDESLYSRQL